MKHNSVYWFIPLLIICLGLLPKALNMDEISQNDVKFENIISSSNNTQTTKDVRPHLARLRKRDLFGSSIADEVVLPQEIVVDSNLWEEFDYQLVGVTKSEGNRQALFIDPESGEKINLRRGERLQGWTISRVLSSRAELTREDQKLWVELFQPEGE